MDIRHLKSLIAIADHNTFAAAGNAVGLTQSAISQQVRKIEDELQIKLFDRSSRPPVLTARGRSLIVGSREIVAQYERVTSEIAGNRLSGNLVLGVMPAALSSSLPRALSTLRNLYPGLRIQLRSRDPKNLMSLVETDQLDAAIVPTQPELAAGLRWSPYATEPLKVVAPASAKERSDQEILEAHPYIRFQRKALISDIIEEEIQRRGIVVKEEMQIDSFASIVLMVSYGLGVSVVPEQGVKRPFPDSVRTVQFGKPALSRTIGIIDKNVAATAEIVDVLHRELWRLSGSLEF